MFLWRACTKHSNPGPGSSVTCYDDPAIKPKDNAAAFDTMVGSGTGTYNGAAATIEFTFRDTRERGASDVVQMTIRQGSNVILSFSFQSTSGCNGKSGPDG